MEYIALGNFDGIHLGHQALICAMVKQAKANNAIASVCIFDPHPMKILFPQNAPKILTSLRYKKEILLSLGIKKIHVLKFDEVMHNMDGIDFLDMLKDKYDVSMFTLGYNYNFGKDGKWNSNDVETYCKKKNIKSLIFDKFMIEELEVSSTIIRKNIRAGNLDVARKLLGKPHIIEGKVVEGNKIGRNLDFPTANFIYEEDFCYPPHGVYLTSTKLDDIWYYSITNIGEKPTINNDIKNIETHILDYDSDLYGKNIYIGFIEKLREQIKFDTLQNLKLQLIKDSNHARKLIETIDIN